MEEQNNKILIYTGADGLTKIDVRLEYSVVRKFRTTASDRKSYMTHYYNRYLTFAYAKDLISEAFASSKSLSRGRERLAKSPVDFCSEQPKDGRDLGIGLRK